MSSYAKISLPTYDKPINKQLVYIMYNDRKCPNCNSSNILAVVVQYLIV